MTRDPPDPRFPNLFVIGAPKCATSSLHSALAVAPDVFMTAVKEPGFFSTDRHFERGTDHYLDAFFGGAQRFSLRGESTPWYLYSTEARQRLKQADQNSAFRFVVLIRQPTDRAYSMFLDQQRAGLEHRSFGQAVTEEMNMSEPDPGSVPPHRRYLWASRYSGHIRAWTACFGSQAVRVFLADDLRQPDQFWVQLSRFLDADLGREQLSELPRSRTNSASGRRWGWVDRALRATDGPAGATIRGARRIVPARWYRRAAQALSTLNQAHGPPVQPPPIEILAMLDEHFRSEISALQELLGRDLSNWLPENTRRG